MLIFKIIILLIFIFGLAGVLTYIHFGRKIEFRPEVESLEDGNISFTIKCTMHPRWITHFLSMLKHMEYLGHIGSSREVGIYSDGDGDFHPSFVWRESLLYNEEKPVRDKNGNVLYDAG